ncbi:exonuclease domain-containing protein [Paenibacillus chitinolyticus]|uniref:3'-5' exonuclease n=1 Tax=Paenibacillus chitinolyticus TaxID=79263 RepID=UPI003D049ABD
MKILFVDTETGGVDPRKHSLLEVGLVAYEVGKGIIDSKEFYISHENYSVTEHAMKINNIDLSIAKDWGHKPHWATHKLLNFIEESFDVIKSKDDRPILGGHNVGFDKSFIEYQLFDASGYDMQKYISHRTIDVMSLLWGLHIAGKLPKEACYSAGANEYFGIKNEKAHTALSDILATVQVYEKAIQLIKGG